MSILKRLTLLATCSAHSITKRPSLRQWRKWRISRSMACRHKSSVPNSPLTSFGRTVWIHTRSACGLSATLPHSCLPSASSSSSCTPSTCSIELDCNYFTSQLTSTVCPLTRKSPGISSRPRQVSSRWVLQLALMNQLAYSVSPWIWSFQEMEVTSASASMHLRSLKWTKSH